MYWIIKLGKECFLCYKFSDLKYVDVKVMCDKILGKVVCNFVYIVVDLFNIIIGFYDKMKEKCGIFFGRCVIVFVFSFNNFDMLFVCDWSVRKCIFVGLFGSVIKFLLSYVK